MGHNSGTFGTEWAQKPSLSFPEKAAELTKSFGTVDCSKFRKKIFESHPQFSLSMSSLYLHIAQKSSYVEANDKLRELDSRLNIGDLNLSSSVHELRVFAQSKASECALTAARCADDHERSFRLCASLAEKYQIDPPEIKKHGLRPSVNRLGCPRWWRRRLLKKQRLIIESVARDLGLVHSRSSLYSSWLSQKDRSAQKAQADAYLSSTFLFNDKQEVFCLKDLYATSISNPAVRRAELMTRINGFEIVADQLGDVGEFYTLTTPSRMHVRFKKGGRENPKYDGTTPSEANEYLQKLWGCIRSKLAREDLYIYGFRVAEPNHDGTPHWHMLFFMEESIRVRVRQILREYALMEDGQEYGAKEHRFKAVPIDKDRGSAAGYIAKYIAKNIDGEGLESDQFGQDSKSSAHAIDTWASRWGIRQFQQIGGPSVTVWRELRRLHMLERRLETDLCQGDNQLSAATAQAASSDWASYVMIMGGPRMRRSQHPIKPFYEEIQVSEETGEIDSDSFTVYGDISKGRIKGLITSYSCVVTRLCKWRIANVQFAPPD